MEIGLRKLDPLKKYAGQLPDKVEYQPPSPITDHIVEAPAKPVVSNIKIDDDGDDDYDDGGRSSNDDRSDSMNPNNDAYWSSRGH